jgi:hypothetical protein
MKLLDLFKPKPEAKLAPRYPAWNATSYRVLALHIEQASDTGRRE